MVRGGTGKGADDRIGQISGRLEAEACVRYPSAVSREQTAAFRRELCAGIDGEGGGPVEGH
jgi:hypothetical protein